MKILFENYSFNASAKTVTFNTTDVITLEQLLVITNVTTNKIIYNFADPNAGNSKETAAVRCEEGGDDVRSSWPLCPGLHTYYNGRYRGLPTREGEPIPENRS